MGEEEEDSEGYLRYKKRRAMHRGPDHHMEPNSSQEGSSWEIEVKPPCGELSVSLFPHLPSYKENGFQVPLSSICVRLRALADTGADVCIINPHDFECFNIPTFPTPPDCPLSGVDCNDLDVLGCAFLS